MFIEVSIFQGTIYEVSCTDRGSCGLGNELCVVGEMSRGPGPGRTSGWGLSARLAMYLPTFIIKINILVACMGASGHFFSASPYKLLGDLLLPWKGTS
jgi:hypothetical protein